ncbi:MAG: hypothetical protein JEZ02_15850 [Desulfatibacillum sp.]|nr:hypothetical protein [Desulfatibacillum sp.]
MSNTSGSSGQLVWGVALTLMGIAVFFRVPQIVPELAQKVNLASGEAFISFCMYLVGIILLGGGIRKLFAHFSSRKDSSDKDQG